MPKAVKTLILLGLAFLIFTFLDKSFFNLRMELSSAIGLSLKNLLPNSDLRERIAFLEKENENLRLQIFNQTIGVDEEIKVYSSYPFNDKREIAIAAGENKNIKVGDLVTYGDGILVGKVVKVFIDSSIVKTIFDPTWKMAVRVGEGEVNALFTGGSELTLSLIAKEAPLVPGDIAITSSRDLGYGLEVGRVKTVEEVKATPFKTSTLESSFDLGDLKNVKIRKISH